jgi:hypothetical protein
VEEPNGGVEPQAYKPRREDASVNREGGIEEGVDGMLSAAGRPWLEPSSPWPRTLPSPNSARQAPFEGEGSQPCQPRRLGLHNHQGLDGGGVKQGLTGVRHLAEAEPAFAAIGAKLLVNDGAGDAQPNDWMFRRPELRPRQCGVTMRLSAKDGLGLTVPIEQHKDDPVSAEPVQGGDRDRAAPT